MKNIQNIIERIKRNPTLLLLIPLGLLLFMIGMIIYLSFQPHSPQEPDQNPNAVITPQASTNISPTMGEMSLEEQAREQAIADKNFRIWEAEVAEKYPWLNELPLQTDSYFFYFDIDKEAFIGTLYPNSTSTIPTQTQVDAMKIEIITELTQLGIPYSNYPLEWEVIPEP